MKSSVSNPARPQVRWKSAAKDKAFDLIRHRILIETQAEHLLAVLRAGKVSTNAFLRKTGSQLRPRHELAAGDDHPPPPMACHPLQGETRHHV